ncbi:hypothetical protein [Pelagibacterium sediminicola]|uniref:hypothetical protein n=1 Tax=Pelagibacterium sediminicola TaxID=2248761 RepID=UPI0018E52BC5|nr:hypothetical protein [Pelagibacterium sediminicola]
MRLFALVLMCIWTVPASASEDLTGTLVPPYPDGMSSQMGACIAADDDVCAYSIAALSGPDGAVVAIFAQKLVGFSDDGPVWEVLDTLDAPEQAEGQIWAFEECHLDGAIDPAVIGLVTARDMGGWLETKDTIWAVRLETDRSELVALDPADIRCVLPGS